MKHMYIRHSVGSRLILDSVIHRISYRMDQTNGNWKFTLELDDEQLAEQLITQRNDLNLFVVDPHKLDYKTWYYSTQGEVEYDKNKRTLTILTDVQIGYNV